ncbi:protein KTI12 homolog [Culex quinquefasciatus]|uniref:protein KTI12 homolog n=1 Tax=Culex quinquefasciatus TaxID=7176 RepID=UPI0018E35E81|nr:protein KTI12 homolog [Culex quinquefasciatus]
MPLVVISGLPASGKSTRAAQIKAHFEGLGKTVHIVSERDCIRVAGYEKNEYFRDSQKEKLVRSSVKSHVLRLLNKNDLLIIDGGNYIMALRAAPDLVDMSTFISDAKLTTIIPIGRFLFRQLPSVPVSHGRIFRLRNVPAWPTCRERC